MDAGPENDLTFIITCVQQFWPDMAITQHLLDHPTSEFVIEFYQRFQETMNEMLSRMICNDTVAADEPKASGDSIFSILRFVNKYFRQPDVDCMSLTLTDLYEPTAKRTKVRFKVLLNLMLFYEQKTDAVRNVISKRLEQLQTIVNKKEEKKVLTEKLAKEAENLAKIEDTLQKLQKEEEKADLRYKSLQKQKIQNDMQHAKQRQELQEVVNTYQNKLTLLKNLQTNVRSLEEQVVTEESYKTLVDLKENLFKKYSELETNIHSLGENLGNRRPVVERFDNINKNLNILSVTCEKQLRVLHNSITSINTQLRISEENYNKKTEELKTRKENASKYEENIKIIEETLQSVTVKNNTLKEKMQQNLEQLKVELNEAQKQQSESTYDKDMLQDKIGAINNHIQEIRCKIEEYNLFFENTYKNILNHENTSTSNFSTMLENIRDALSQDEQDCENPTTESEEHVK